MPTKQELEQTVQKLTSDNQTLNRTVDKLEDMLHAVSHQPAKQNHSVEIGGTINLGNYSNITLKVQLGFTGEDVETVLKTAIATARTALGATLVETLQMPTEGQIPEVSSKIPKHIEGIVKNNPFAVWLIAGIIETELEEIPF